MPNLLGIGTNRGYSMTGFGIGLGLSGYRLGSYIDPTLKLDLNFAQQRSLTALIGPTPIYSRASTGNSFDSSGVWTQSAINAARFGYLYNGSSWISRGLLLEEQRTNLLLYSENFTNAAWVKQNSITITANAAVWIDGTTSASRLTMPANSSHKNLYQSVSVSTLTYTFSGYFKADTAIWVALTFSGTNTDGVYFDLQNGVLGSSYGGVTGTIVNVGNGWFFCTITKALTAGTAIPRVECHTANAQGSAWVSSGGESIYLKGLQLEAGSSASSYSATTTGAVIRSADVCQITGTDFSNIWNAAEGTFVFEGICPAVGTLGLLSVNDGTANERIELYASGTDPKFIVVDGGVTQADIDGGTLTANTAFKMAVRYKANDFAVSVNGGAVVTDTAGTLPTVTQMQLGTNQAGNGQNGFVSRLRYYNAALTDANLVSLST